jgi:hypothetical protein
MELALGTVQFGLQYGIAGRSTAVPPEEAREILRCAHNRGIRVLDTAVAYGDIEERLLELMDGLDFRVVSKLPPCPPGLASADAIARWARAQVRQSRERLGAALAALLFHRADDLLETGGDNLWQAASDACAGLGIESIGASVYDPDTLERLCSRFPIALAQLPGNALDQRVTQLGTAVTGFALPGLHLRSAFLQGLLLMPESDALARLPQAGAALRRWHAWRAERSLAPLPAALGIVKGFAGVSHCVVGVDSLAQLEAIVDAWRSAPTLTAPELASQDGSVIDPRTWKVAA